MISNKDGKYISTASEAKQNATLNIKMQDGEIQVVGK